MVSTAIRFAGFLTVHAALVVLLMLILGQQTGRLSWALFHLFSLHAPRVCFNPAIPSPYAGTS